MSETLFTAAKACLDACEADEKVSCTKAAVEAWRAGELAWTEECAAKPIGEPGRPPGLKLVRPRDLPKRRPTTPEGRAVLYHALTHIEFNAINLAWDAAYRFRGMPQPFYDDWVRVADEEAYHFTLLRDHLRGLGYDYGDFPGHNGLWEMARKTAHDPLIRMALVPRCLEARGLDVTPGIKARLLEAGDADGAALLDIILRDEIGHVAIGDRWFRFLCTDRDLEPETTYRALTDEYMKGPLRGPFHQEARRQAGFSEAELAYLEGVG
ncbi:ferritin-like domain-containing protein [Thiohalomonas denitrificans]|uniref:ferritin-like domain-containing protein n=1 Tax=Thiohalomonas denitrificans TaxID=415747 RepID=UPI0026F154DD|nr:ferritin-like domain-containing protein [Thiohalomonas denitrificans]